jgi:hypothetical protein
LLIRNKNIKYFFSTVGQMQELKAVTSLLAGQPKIAPQN